MQTPRPTPPYTQLRQDESRLNPNHESTLGGRSRRPASPAALTRNGPALAMPSLEPPVSTKPVAMCPEVLPGMRRFEQGLSEEMLRRFEGVVRRLSQLLASHLCKSRHEHRPTAIRLAFLGKDETSVRPYIVVLCPELVQKRAEKFFKKEVVRQIYQSDEPGRESLKVVVVGQPPRSRAGEFASTVKVAPAYSVNSASSGNTSCRLQVKAEHDGVSRLATIGGYIVSSCHDGTETIYGLTAGHIFPQTGYDSSSSDEPWDGSMPSPTSRISEDEEDVLPEQIDQSRNQSELEGFTVAKGEPAWTDMRLADVSFSREARDKDWALIEGLQKHQIDSLNIGATNATIVLGTIGERQSLQIGFDVEVALRCVLSRTPSMILTPSGHNFVPAHILIPDAPQPLPDGASGTWVISEPARDPDLNVNHISVYGQVVADDVFGDVYMIPLHCIMDDVKKLMDAAVVRLPASMKELRQILMTQLHREHAGPDCGKGSKDSHSLITHTTGELIDNSATTDSTQDHSLVFESPNSLLSDKPKRSVHAREPQVRICPICGRSFARKYILKRHERNHEQGDLLRCSQCKRTFPRKDLLERHEARHQESLSAEIDDTETDLPETDAEDMHDPTKKGKMRQDNVNRMLVSPTKAVPELENTSLSSDYSTFKSSIYFSEDKPLSQGSPATAVSGVEDNHDGELSESSDRSHKAKKSRTEAPWTPKEDLCLKRMRGEGASWDRIMDTFSDRPESSVKNHWYKDLHHEGIVEDAPAPASVPKQGE